MQVLGLDHQGAGGFEARTYLGENPLFDQKISSLSLRCFGPQVSRQRAVVTGLLEEDFHALRHASSAASKAKNTKQAPINHRVNEDSAS